MRDDEPIEKMTIQEILDLLEARKGVVAWINKEIYEKIPIYYRNRMVIFYKREVKDLYPFLGGG